MTQRSLFRRIVKRFASLKLAVVIILALGSLSAWGTFVEARYNDSMAAQRIVYQSIWMYATLVMLAVSLLAVMIDRWPWQKKHAGFVLAHIGILTLILGAWLTQRFGVDGSISFGIGQSSRAVAMGEIDFAVYSSIDGERYAPMYSRPVDFFLNPPTEKDPLRVSLPDGEMEVVDYYPYALRDEKTVAAKNVDGQPSPEAGSAIRFQLQNDRVNMTDWIQQTAPQRDAVRDLGPARIVLTRQEKLPPTEGNAIVLKPLGDSGRIAYEIRTAREPNKPKRGEADAGSAIATGWMGLTFRVLKVLPRAKTEVTYKQVQASAPPATTSAVKVKFLGQEQWVGLNSSLKLFSDNAVYILTYRNRIHNLDFDLKLKKFTVGRYQGTMRAASYESVVDTPDASGVTISMNEPLKYKGFTFYQASFNEDDQGKPTASILSVNRDPGRPFKYLGSLLIVFGSAYMFWFKRAALARAKGQSERGRP